MARFKRILLKLSGESLMGEKQCGHNRRERIGNGQDRKEEITFHHRRLW